MRRIQIIILSVIFCTASFAQMEKVWKKEILIHSDNQYLAFCTTIEDQVIYNMGWSEEVNGEAEHHNYLHVLDYEGNDLWSFDWADQFDNDFAIDISKNELTNTLFFLVNDRRWDSLDYVGVITPMSGIEWIRPVSGIANYVLQGHTPIMNDFVFSERKDSLYRLVSIDDQGIRNWEIDLFLEGSSAHIISGNKTDRLIWAVDGIVHLVDAEGKLIALKQGNLLPPFYSIVQMHDERIDVFGWGLPYYLKGLTEELQDDYVVDLPYTNDSFLSPIVNMDSDAAGNLYLTGVDIKGNLPPVPFMLCYDSSSNLKWTHNPVNTVITMHIEDEYVIYVTPNSIVQLNPSNGELIWEEQLVDDENLVDIRFNSLSDWDNRTFFAFTKKAGTFYLTKYNILPTSVESGNSTITEHSIYPNPLNSILKIRNGHYDILRIYDIYGKLVREALKTDNEINVSNLSSGTYVVELLDRDFKVISVQKVIKL